MTDFSFSSWTIQAKSKNLRWSCVYIIMNDLIGWFQHRVKFWSVLLSDVDWWFKRHHFSWMQSYKKIWLRFSRYVGTWPDVTKASQDNFRSRDRDPSFPRLITKLQKRDKNSSFTDSTVTKKYADNREPKTLPGRIYSRAFFGAALFKLTMVIKKFLRKSHWQNVFSTFIEATEILNEYFARG